MTGFGGVAEQEAEQAATSFRKQEPTILTHLLAAPILGVVTLFAPGHADKPAEQITAAVVTALILAQGFVLRRFVNSKWKRLTGHDLPSEVTDELDPDAAKHRPAAETVAEGAVSPHKAAKLAGHPSPNAG